MRILFAALALSAVVAAGCGDSSVDMAGPGPVSAMSGTWVGEASDSTTSALGPGGMMGQSGMGRMTWQLSQNGSTLTGTMQFAGVPGFTMPGGMVPGTFSGTINGDQIQFTMTLPAGSMMSGACTAQATGTGHFEGNTFTGTYQGTNSCTGAFTNGTLTLARR